LDLIVGGIVELDFAFEAHVDGHSAFNGGVDGSRPSGGTRRDCY